MSMCITGGAYLPLDVTYPRNLVKDVILDAKPTAAITNRTTYEKIKGMPISTISLPFPSQGEGYHYQSQLEQVVFSNHVSGERMKQERQVPLLF